MEQTNPIDNSTILNGKSKKRTMSKSLEKRDPIALEIKDNSKIQNVFKNFPIYPYAGTSNNSAHSLMSFFYRLARLSKTDGSCIKRISEFVIGDGVRVEMIDDEFIDETDLSVSDEVKNKFKEVIRSGIIHEHTLTKLGEKLFYNYKVTGDYFLMLTLKETLGVKSYELKVIHNEDIKYMIDANKNPIDLFAISPVWEDKYLKDNPPTIIHKFPMFTDFGNGVNATIFHTQNGGNRHGRPDTMEVTPYKYSEFQNVDYRIKQTDSGWTGDLIIEMGQGDPESNSVLSGATSNVKDFEDNFTNKSDDPLSFFITERPHGADAMVVHQVKPNTKEAFYKTVDELDSEAIIGAHGWSSRLLGKAVSNGLSDTVYIEELKTKIPMIKGLRKGLLFDINNAITEIMKWMEPSLIGVGINYSSLLLEKIEESEKQTKTT